jgi:drug/metabolite transporter (DMT)-like permease
VSDMLWVAATLVAAAAQTFRNALQSGLTREIGTIGATQVRFLYGLPFAVLFLLLVLFASGEPMPALTATGWGFVTFGALAQVGGTALMLVAMRLQSFGVAYAYIKTEPVIVAIAAFLLIGDPLSLAKISAIILATIGVLLASGSLARPASLTTELRPALAGIAAGGLFGLSAVGFRGAILDLGDGPFYVRATTVLVWSLVIQCSVLICYMALRDRAAMSGSLRVWRSSLGAGLLGAIASMGWFLGFSLTAAANVRTLGLVEIILAALVSRRLFRETIRWHEAAGMALVLVGVGLLLRASP